MCSNPNQLFSSVPLSQFLACWLACSPHTLILKCACSNSTTLFWWCSRILHKAAIHLAFIHIFPSTVSNPNCFFIIYLAQFSVVIIHSAWIIIHVSNKKNNSLVSHVLATVLSSRQMNSDLYKCPQLENSACGTLSHGEFYIWTHRGRTNVQTCNNCILHHWRGSRKKICKHNTYGCVT